MPTTLPIRSPECAYGRKRGISKSTAVLLLWAITLLALTLPVRTGHTAGADVIAEVLLP